MVGSHSPQMLRAIHVACVSAIDDLNMLPKLQCLGCVSCAVCCRRRPLAATAVTGKTSTVPGIRNLPKLTVTFDLPTLLAAPATRVATVAHKTELRLVQTATMPVAATVAAVLPPTLLLSPLTAVPCQSWRLQLRMLRLRLRL